MSEALKVVHDESGHQFEVVLEAALQYAQSIGYTVIPSCSYVERYMERAERNASRSS